MEYHNNEIKKVSQVLLKEVVKTIPVQPIYGHITFLANGIEYNPPTIPLFMDEEESKKVKQKPREKFIKKCYANNIIPFSGAEFKFDSLNNYFMSSEAGIINSSETLPEETAEIINKSISGGKIQYIKFKLDPGTYTAFLKNHFNELLKQKYEINDFNLVLSTFYSREGRHSDSSIFLPGRNLELRLGCREEHKGDLTKVKKWFRELKKRYQSK